MRNILILCILISVIVLTFACGGDSAKDENKSNVVVKQGLKIKYAEGMVVRIGDPIPQLPTWIEKLDSIETIDGEKWFCVISRADSVSDTMAEQAAKAAALGEIAEGVKVTVLKSFGEASEAYGSADAEQIEKVRKTMLATKAKVTLKDTRTISRFTDQVAKITRVEGDKVEVGKPYFLCYIKVGINYDMYKKIRDGYMNDAKKAIKPNPTQKRLLKDTEAALRSLDGKPNVEYTYEDEAKYDPQEADGAPVTAAYE